MSQFWVAVRRALSPRSNWRRPGCGVILIDEKLAWEKPCGGGLTHKAYSQYPFLIENSTPKRMVTETVLAAPKAGEVTLKLGDPLLIYSRFDLNSMLLERAERAGAQIEKTRVTGMERQGAGWRLQTAGGNVDADFCIVATGARNPLRDVGTQLTPPDTMSALGYYVPGEQEQIDIQFLPDLEGYIWVFPRCGHLSVGICGKGEPASALRKRLEAYMAETRHQLEGRAVLQPPAAVAGHEIVEGEPGGGRWLDGGGRRRRPGGSDHRRRPVLRDPLGRPGGAEPAGGRGRSGGKHASLPQAAAPRFRGRPGVRLAAGEAGVSGTFPVWVGAAAHGAVHAPQSRALRASCRICSPASSPTWG